MIGRDGSFRSVETVGLQAQFEGQSSIVVMVRDLTERKRAEEALRISEAKYSGIVSISADAIISIDDEQRISDLQRWSGEDLWLFQVRGHRDSAGASSFLNGFAGLIVSTSSGLRAAM